MKTRKIRIKFNSSFTKPLEKEVCKQFYRRVRIMQAYNQFGFEFFIFHVGNESPSSNGYRIELGRMGVRAGVADYCIIYGEGKVAFIEFKRDNKCKLTEKQEDFKIVCERLKTPHFVAYDTDIAIEWLKGLH